MDVRVEVWLEKHDAVAAGVRVKYRGESTVRSTVRSGVGSTVGSTVGGEDKGRRWGRGAVGGEGRGSN